MMFGDLKGRLKLRDIRLKLSNPAIQWLCKEGCDQQYGARPLRHLIEQHIEKHIAGELLRGDVKPGHTVFVDLKDGALTFASVGSETS
jgi:ATP-dependent Clp protease ATP-binding subunit ClpA